MSNPRDIRRRAMQVLYEIDLRGEADRSAIEQELADDPFDTLQVRQAAFELACAAWQGRAAADDMIGELTPDWPTHRQPPIDRAILRLAHHEMSTGRVPVKVAINEAVELSKQYGSEHSPPFINGVLDKLARQLAGAGAEQESGRAGEQEAEAL